ncbi:uncharacterized protein C17orf113-like [Babylonia areolata]|uniref:uncharacterized protein C17orf113-like n=1 Tax=Babylonia areolata TaxID=304850 RepID=UPI003FD0E273
MQRKLSSFFSSSRETIAPEQSPAAASEQLATSTSSAPTLSSETTTLPAKKPRLEVHKRWNVLWKRDFPWLSDSSADMGQLFCDLCIKAGESNAFTKGCTDMQKSALVRHQKTKDHVRAESLVASRKLMKQQVDRAATESVTKQTAMIRSAYWLAKEMVPNVKFSSLLELQKANGCSQLEGDCYSHHSAVSEMQDCIATAMETQALSDVHNSPFVGVIIDETLATSTSSAPTLSSETTTLPAKKPRLEVHKRWNVLWKRDFPWLSDSSADMGQLFCDLCIKAGESNAFTKGCTDMQKSALVRHQKTKDHVRAESLVASRKLMKQQVDRAATESVTKQTAMIRSAYWLAKEMVPNVKFSSLLELQKANGCSQLEGDCYSHHSAVSEMQDCIATAMETQALSDVHNSPFVGVIIDETVNVTVNKKLIIFLRYTKNGEAHTTFCGNYTVSAGDAETVFNKVSQVLNQKGIDTVKVIGLGSDGASVMFGKNSGVGVRLQQICPHLVHVHCAAHRVALVASNAARDTPKVADCRRVLNSVHFYFKNSALRYERLRELHRAFDDSDFVSLKEPCSVRWVSFTKALESVYANWELLVIVLEQDGRKNPAAEGIARQLRAYWFVATMHMLLDILPVIDRLNKCFQEENVNLSVIKPRVASTRQRLADFLHTVGPTEQEFTGVHNSYKGQDLLHCDAVRVRSYTTMREAFLQSLIQNLDNRFPTADLDILTALGAIFDVRMYPARNLQQHATDALDTVIDRFAADGGDNVLIERDRALRDFPEFKYTLQAHNPDSFEKACKVVIMDYDATYPDFAVLANIALTVPVSSVPCERGFSWQNMIKTADRSRLTDAHVDTLLRIAMEGPALSQCNELIVRACGEFQRRRERRK